MDGLNCRLNNVVCFLCDHVFKSEEESWMIFNEIYFKKNQIITTLSEILSSILRYKIDEESAHSIFLCTKCKIVTLEFKSIEQQYKKLHNRIVTTYNQTAEIYRSKTEGNIKVEIQETFVDFNEYDKTLRNEDNEMEEDINLTTTNMKQINEQYTNNDSNTDDDDDNDNDEILKNKDDTIENTKMNKSDIEEAEEETEEEEEAEEAEEVDEEAETDVEEAETEAAEAEETEAEIAAIVADIVEIEAAETEADETDTEAAEAEAIAKEIDLDSDIELDVVDDETAAQEEEETFSWNSEELSSENESISETLSEKQNIKSENQKSNNSKEKFKCKICEKQLANKYTLKAHMETQHDLHETSKKIQITASADGFKCEICGKIMPHKKSLTVHLRRHNTERKRPYECDICFKKFFHPFNLKRHKMIHSVIQRPYICDICNKGFPENCKLFYHKKRHNDTEVFVYHCEICNKPLSNKSDLPRHKELFCEVLRQKNGIVDSTAVDKLKQMNCLKCGQKFLTRKEAQPTDRKSLQCDNCNVENSDKEIEYDENILKNVYKCYECGKLFAAKSTLKLHMQIHKINNEHQRPLSPWSENDSSMEKSQNVAPSGPITDNVCDKCGKFFATLKTLKHHMELHNEIFYECDICKVNFPHKRNLVLHRNFHIKGTQPKYECDVCNKKFGTRGKLKQHIPVHSNQSYSCDECGKVFSQMRYLRSHKKEKLKKRNYQCEICDKSFVTKNSLTEHEGSHIDVNEYLFQCGNCEKKFYTRTELKRHKVRHFDSPDSGTAFICEFCEKRFLSKNALERHEAGVHLGIRKYLCDICGKSFPYPGSLRSHYAVHSSEYPFACHICKRPFKNRNRLLTHIRYSKHKKNLKFKPKNESTEVD